jgi:hypothetical protein
MRARMLRTLMISGAIALSACGSNTGYEKAFSSQSALVGNSQDFDASADVTFRTVKVTLVQQGFTIETADIANGLIKAIRSLQDPKKADYAYLVTATVDITGKPSGRSTTVTVAASEQTVLHKDSATYYHLLGLVPIPTGREHQTVVTKEGNIDKASFYSDFFATVHKNLSSAVLAAASEATVAPLPAAAVTSARPSPPDSAPAPLGPPVAEAAAPATAATPIPAAAPPTASPPSPKSTANPDTLAPLEP